MIKINNIIRDHEPINVILVGAGSTGSRMAVSLMELNGVLLTLGRKGIHLHIVDDDIIEKHNCHKQKYLDDDIGKYKAIVLAERLSYTFGASVDAHVVKLNRKSYREDINEHLNLHSKLANVIISTIDNVKGRIELEKLVNKISGSTNNYADNTFWYDLGNADYTGQVILKHRKSKELNGKIDWSKYNDEPDQISCSMAESLDKQSFIINQFIVDSAMLMISDLFIHGEIKLSELYINLKDFKVTSKKV